MQIKDKKRAIKMVLKDGIKIKYLSDELKNDLEIAILAISQNPNAFYYLGAKIKKDPAVADYHLNAKNMLKSCETNNGCEPCNN